MLLVNATSMPSLSEQENVMLSLIADAIRISRPRIGAAAKLVVGIATKYESPGARFDIVRKSAAGDIIYACQLKGNDLSAHAHHVRLVFTAEV